MDLKNHYKHNGDELLKLLLWAGTDSKSLLVTKTGDADETNLTSTLFTVGAIINSESGATTTSTESRYYAVLKDSNGLLFVNVPWAAASGTVTADSTLTADTIILGAGLYGIKTSSKKIATVISTATGTESATINNENNNWVPTNDAVYDFVTSYAGISKVGTVTSVTPGTGLRNGTATTAITESGTLNLISATTSELGGFKASNVLTTAQTLTSGNGTTSNRFYGVQIDKDGVAFVNVPWTENDDVDKILYSESTATTLDTTGKTGTITVYGGTTFPTTTHQLVDSVAIANYVSNLISSAVLYLGTVAATSGLSTSAGKGDFYRVTTDITSNSLTAHAGDLLIASLDNPTADFSSTGYTIAHTANDTWVANTKSSAGYVAAPGASGAAYRLWGTGTTPGSDPSWQTLWLATTSAVGGFKLAAAADSTLTKMSSSTTGDGNYAVKMNADGTLYVAITQADTHYSSKNVVGATASAYANAANTTTNSIYLNHIESNSNTPTSSHNIVGSGSVTVACDANGKITITGATYTSNVTSHLYVTGSAGTTKTTTALANESVYLKLYEGTTAGESYLIKGAKGIEVITDASGNITILHTHTDITALSTAALCKIAYDALGHITSTSSWDPYTLAFLNAGTALTNATYDPDGSAAKTINFSTGLSASYASNVVTVTAASPYTRDVTNSGAKSLTIPTAWTSSTFALPTTAGTYVLEVNDGSSYAAGVFVIGGTDDINDEIAMHMSGTNNRIYVRTGATYFYLARANADGSAKTYNLSYRRIL